MDTVIWLLDQGVDPGKITWIRPRDSWLINRKVMQISFDFFSGTVGALAAELESARDASSIDDLFARLEAAGLLTRIDPKVEPTMYRCAIVSDAELTQLRRVTNVVRMGHVKAIEADRIVLDQGQVPTSARNVHVNCSADGIPRLPEQPVFQGDRIKVQYVRWCSPTFSGAFIAHVEATLSNDDEKNALCRPVQIPDEPIDWLRMQLAAAQNSYFWSKSPEIQKWLHGARLDGYTAMFVKARQEPTPENTAIVERYLQALKPGLAQMAKLLAAAG